VVASPTVSEIAYESTQTPKITISINALPSLGCFPRCSLPRRKLEYLGYCHWKPSWSQLSSFTHIASVWRTDGPILLWRLLRLALQGMRRAVKINVHLSLGLLSFSRTGVSCALWRQRQAFIITVAAKKLDWWNIR